MTSSGSVEDGPIPVLHFQPEERARPRDPPAGLCGSLCGVWVHGRGFSQGYPAEYLQDAGVGRTGEILTLCQKLFPTDDQRARSQDQHVTFKYYNDP